MTISADALVRLRPYLFHLTASSNIAAIDRARKLKSAARLLTEAGRKDLIGVRRKLHLPVKIDGFEVQLRDQAPLHAGNMALPKGWSFEDFVAHLDGRVFFWPGNGNGPIAYGQRHFERYANEKPTILRIPTASVLAANSTNPPLFCRYNSGSPRCSNGRKSPRGDTTFVSGADADFGVARAIEVTFLGEITLPTDAEIGRSPAGPWQPLQASARRR